MLPKSWFSKPIFSHSAGSRIFREISCGHFSWKSKDENLQKKFAKISSRFSPVSANNFACVSLSGIMVIIDIRNRNRKNRAISAHSGHCQPRPDQACSTPVKQGKVLHEGAILEELLESIAEPLQAHWCLGWRKVWEKLTQAPLNQGACSGDRTLRKGMFLRSKHFLRHPPF